MPDNHNTTELADAGASTERAGDGFIRRIIFPLLVVAAIIAAIWWLEQRSDGDVDPFGERYGPIALPVALQPPGLDVSPKEGALAPDFLLERLDAGELRLSDFRGRPVVLNFWATWCAPCRKEIPQFVDAYDRYETEGLIVIGLNLQEGKSIVGRYAEDFGMNFPIAIDRDGEVGDRYRLLGLPTTFFIDRDGVISSVFTGPFQEKAGDTEVRGAIEENELEQRITAILASLPPGEAANE
jgi:peroxiredoxin